MWTMLIVDYSRSPLFQTGWGQGEEFIAMLNPVTWPKMTWGGDCNGYTSVVSHDLSCIAEISTTGTTQINGGTAFQEAAAVQK